LTKCLFLQFIGNRGSGLSGIAGILGKNRKLPLASLVRLSRRPWPVSGAVRSFRE
jgi:hypothetical protein